MEQPDRVEEVVVLGLFYFLCPRLAGLNDTLIYVNMQICKYEDHGAAEDRPGIAVRR